MQDGRQRGGVVQSKSRVSVSRDKRSRRSRKGERREGKSAAGVMLVILPPGALITFFFCCKRATQQRQGIKKSAKWKEFHRDTRPCDGARLGARVHQAAKQARRERSAHAGQSEQVTGRAFSERVKGRREQAADREVRGDDELAAHTSCAIARSE